MKLLVTTGLAFALAVQAAPVCAAPLMSGAAKMTLAEFQAAQWSRFARADANNDGKVTRAEFDAMNAARGDAGRGGRMWGMLDPAGAGYVTRAQVAQVAAKRFARLDANHDGVLTAAEFQAGRMARAGSAQ